MNPVPLVSSLVSLVGVVLLLKLFLGGRGELVALFFALQLADMMLGQVLEFQASITGWSPGEYKLYYLSSPLSAGLLAVGVLMALGYRRAAWGFLAYSLVHAIILGSRLATSPVDMVVLQQLGEGVGGAALPPSVRVLSPLLTVPSGLVALILPTAALLRRGRSLPAGFKRGLMAVVLGNLVFLVAGVLLRKGYGQLFLVLELTATLILVYAFLMLSKTSGRRATM